MVKCTGPKDGKLFGDRCGKPAVWRTRIGQPVCRDCGAEMKRAHEAGETILSMVHPASEFPLRPIH